MEGLKGGKALPPGLGDTAREWCDPTASATAGPWASFLVLTLPALGVGSTSLLREPFRAWALFCV